MAENISSQFQPVFDFEISDDLLFQVPMEDVDSKQCEKKQEKTRFAALSEKELDLIVDNSEAKATKSATKWGVKIFEGKINITF
jgi:hypothetical protein